MDVSQIGCLFKKFINVKIYIFGILTKFVFPMTKFVFPMTNFVIAKTNFVISGKNVKKKKKNGF